MQETRHILQFSEIGGVRRNPSTTEDGKFPRYNDTSRKFDYTCIGDGGDSDINLTYFNNLISNIINTTSNNTYLYDVTRQGNSGKFTMSNGTIHYLSLGSLAWEDSVETTLTLPGDTKVLYDNNDEIGGSANFTYNYTSDKVQFKAPLTFDTTEGTYKEGLRYLGNFSWSIGGGDVGVPTKSGSYNLLSGFKAGATFGASSTNNTLIGSYTGQYAGTDLEGSIFIGAYAGRYENVSNKFFLDNVDYTDGTTSAQNNSFLYADLATERRLYIRDRLSVEKEGKFGESGLTDGNGETGMFQMLSTGTGTVKPQYYSNGEWQDFANSIDTYLDDVTYSEGELTFTLSDASTIGPIDISDINTTTFATSPSSPSTGQTATSNYGYIQISNNSFTNNEGFTYKTGLRWEEVSKQLYIPGAVNIATLTSDSGLSNSSVWSDGDHAYIKLNGTSIQIDNEELPEEGINGLNIGGATYEVFKQRVDDDLEFRTFQTMPIGTNNPNDRIKMSYSTDGNAVFIGTNAERNRLDTVIDSAFNDVAIDRDNSGETLLMRALRPGTGVTLTQTEEYITIDATGAGGGEVNTMNNNGSGLEFYAAKNGAQFEMFTLSTSDTRISLGQATDYTTDPENTIDLDLGFTSADAAVVGTGEASLKATISGTGVTGDLYTFTHKKLTSPLSSITIAETATEIQIEAGSAAATGTNLGSGTIEIFDDSSTMPNFEFNTIRNTGRHLSIVNDAHLIKFDVDNLTYSYNGDSLDSLELLAGTSGFEIVSKGIAVTSTSGLTLSESTEDDIIIDQPIPIPYFKETVSGTFDSVNTGSTTSKINYSFTYDSDYRDGDDSASTKFFELNLGSGLSYDSATNTLNSNFSSGGSTTDNYLTYADITDNTLTLKVGTSLDDDAIAVYSLDLPTYTLPVAEVTNYTGSTGSTGGIKVDEFKAGWVLGDTSTLNLDTVTGKLSSNKLIVTYGEQNYLHDEHNLDATLGIPPSTELNINTLREQARANIGAAYVEGSLTEDFNAQNLNVDVALTASSTTEEHSIGDLRVNNGSINSDTADIKIQKGPLDNESGVHRPYIKVSDYSIYINLGSIVGSEKVIFLNGGGERIMVLTQDGDLFIKGNIYSESDIEAFANTTEV